MNKYYIKFGISQNFNAGSKAMKDIMSLLESQGYAPIMSLPTNVHRIFKLIDLPILVITLFFKVRKKGIILYFVPSNLQRIKLLKLLKKVIGYRLVCFINDIECLRMVKNEKQTEAEIKSIACADTVLVPNNNSVQILQYKYKFTNQLIPVGVWDYLNNYRNQTFESLNERAFYNKTIAFAGNLEKAPFVKDLHLINLKFKIWGNDSKIKNGKNIQYMGVKFHDELIEDIKGCTWGLVWDGTSVYSCAGSFGSYLKFNNSHKCGLYLAARIPVIVWDESGMASFVTKYKVGICVSSLQEAANRINQMSLETYCMYRKNTQNIGQYISEGKFFLEALRKLQTKS